MILFVFVGSFNFLGLGYMGPVRFVNLTWTNDGSYNSPSKKSNYTTPLYTLTFLYGKKAPLHPTRC